MKQRMSKKRSKSSNELNADLAAFAQMLREREKLDGVLECSLLREDREGEPVLPWAKRYWTLDQTGFLAHDPEDHEKILFSLDVSDIASVSLSPFQIGFVRDMKHHLLGINTSQEEVGHWMSSINAIRQLRHLSSSDAFERKSTTPSALTKSSSYDRLSKLMESFRTSSLDEEIENAEPSSVTAPIEEKKTVINRQELEKLLLAVTNDPVGEVWGQFAERMMTTKEIADVLEPAIGPEVFQDTFSNLIEVLEKTFDVLHGYVMLRSNPEAHGSAFKDECKELEAFSSFCANKDQAISVLRGAPESTVSAEHKAILEESFNQPLAAIGAFSEALKKYSKEPGFPSSEFDEASSILQDVEDNIENVSTMFQDWVATTEDQHRKRFLSPAKRSLLYVDPTLDYPAILFSDCLALFEVVKNAEGDEVHQSLHVLPLSLLQIEDAGKHTVFKVSSLGRECKVKSQNNRAATVLRRKVSEARDLFVKKISVGLRPITQSPDSLDINCCVTLGERMLVGTDQGLFLLNLRERELVPVKIPNCDQRIVKLEVSSCLEMIFMTCQDKEETTKRLMVHPLVSLTSLPVIQRCIFPEEITKEPLDLLASCENGDYRSLFMLKGKTLEVKDLGQDGTLIPLGTEELDEEQTFMKFMAMNIWMGSKSIMKSIAPPSPDMNHSATVMKNLDDSQPLNCLLLNNLLLFCFERHGVLMNPERQEVVSVPVWLESAKSFGFLDPYVLVFTEQMVEVRHKDRMWELLQVLETPAMSVLNWDEHIVLLNNQIAQVQRIAAEC